MSAPLARHLPQVFEADSDEILDRFLAWVTEIGLTLYPAQEEALLELMAGRHVILGTPTGSGKSLVALALAFKALSEGQRFFYTSPIKALANEKFFSFCRELGKDRVGMLTGDASINGDAPVILCTAEVLANMALRRGRSLGVPYVVMDEFHYYGDRDRGWAWQVPLVSMPDTTFLLMSATLGDTSVIEKRIEKRTGGEVARVASGERPVPLHFEYRNAVLHETVQALLDEDRAPVYVVSFTQRDCAERAQALVSAEVSDRERKREIATALEGARFDSPYGKDMQRFLRAGIGIHHAGLLPRYRLLVEKLAQQGLLRVICGTDTLGVGVNIPIRTVLFSQLCKFDGVKTARLAVRHFQQISGRAGRKGFDDQGWVVAQPPAHVVENARLVEKADASGRKKRVVKKKPPTRGFVSWNRADFEGLVSNAPEPLQPSFQLSHGMVLSLLARDSSADEVSGYRAVLDLIARSHSTDAMKARLKRHAARVIRSLVTADIVRIVRDPNTGRHSLEVSTDLQHDFSLHHTLSLYLVAVLESLDPNAQDYALDVLTFVESILENPRAILFRQLDRAKGELIGRLKAEGVPYEDRMRELEDVTYPKPNAEAVYATFNAFTARHPWVSGEDIRPKSIAREIYENLIGFEGYVKELGLERSEGVLLRYLNQVFGTLTQTVPESARTETLEEMMLFFRGMLARADSSLMEEWQRSDSDAPGQTAEAATEAEASTRPKALRARARVELHRVLRALANADFEAAAACLRPREGDDPWDATRLEAALAPFRERHGAVRFDHHARLSEYTQLRPIASQRIELIQRVIGTTDDDETPWFLTAEIDASRPLPPDEPVLELVSLEA